MNDQGETVHVKICGITCLEDAEAAIACGADALGFVFAKESPRYIPPADAGQIISQLPPFITSVGVLTSATEIVSLMNITRINLIQFHGDFSRAILKRFSHCGIGVLRVRDAQSICDLPHYPFRALLLDGFDHKKLGGTGVSFDWSLVASLTERTHAPLIIAGGLTPENVRDACRVTRPYGVDVSSGVEHSPGRKDPKKMAAFIRAAKNA